MFAFEHGVNTMSEDFVVQQNQGGGAEGAAHCSALTMTSTYCLFAGALCDPLRPTPLALVESLVGDGLQREEPLEPPDRPEPQQGQPLEPPEQPQRGLGLPRRQRAGSHRFG